MIDVQNQLYEWTCFQNQRTRPERYSRGNLVEQSRKNLMRRLCMRDASLYSHRTYQKTNGAVLCSLIFDEDWRAQRTYSM